MFDIGGIELLVIGVVALIIVGPKDLPRLVRSVGQWVGKARGLAREFQSGMEEAARQADLDEIRDVGKIGSEVERDIKAAAGDRRGGAAQGGVKSASAKPGAPKPGAPKPGATRPSPPPERAAERGPDRGADRGQERLTDRLRSARDADDRV